MARIRTIKPEFPEDEKLGACTRDARLLFILIWTLCDDHGRFRASPVFLRTHLFPYDLDITPQDIAGWLNELHAKRRVELYEVEGETYGLVTNWGRHQRVDNAGRPLYPDPPNTDSPRVSASLGEPPRDSAGPGPGPRPGPPTTDPREPQPAAAPQPVDKSNLQVVWELMADRAIRDSRTQIANPTAFRRKVIANARKEHTDRALELIDEFEDLTATKLADVLAGSTTVLRTARRKKAS